MEELRLDDEAGGDGWRWRVKAERLGRWERSEIVGFWAVGSLSEAEAETLDEADDKCFWGLLLRLLGWGTDCEDASDAARRSLSSWYFRRDSIGRTPFSR